jgi:hypothetical protein
MLYDSNMAAYTALLHLVQSSQFQNLYCPYSNSEFMTIELKPAQFSDYIIVAKIHAQSWQKNYRNIFSDKFLNEEV